MNTMRGGVGDVRHLGLVMGGRQELGTCRPRRIARAVRRTCTALALPVASVVIIAYAAWLTLVP